MSRISYRFLVPGSSAKLLVSAHDRIMGTHRVHAVDTLSDACGFVTVVGQRALRPGCVTACKAALVQMARPASTVEVAEVAGHNPTAVAKALSACDSARRIGPGMWTAVAPRRFESGSGPGLTPDGSSYVTSSCGANTQGGAADPMDMPSGRSGRNRASAPRVGAWQWSHARSLL